MYTRTTKKVLKQVAKKYGVSIREVKKEINHAIDQAYLTSQYDCSIKSKLEQIPCNGKVNVEDIIRYSALKLKL